MSDAKTNRNQRIMDRYNELIRQPGAHGHYETIFRIVREEVERMRDAAAAIAEDVKVNRMRVDSRQGAYAAYFIAERIRALD